jgi:multiple sugar transport system substrate-binding protein
MMGYPPLRPGTVKDERYLKDWAEANPLVLPNLEQIEYVTPWQSYPGQHWLQIETILMDALNKCLFTDADVAGTMRAAQTQAQSLMP